MIDYRIFIVPFQIEDARSLEEIIASDPHKKPYILRNLKEILVSLIQKYVENVTFFAAYCWVHATIYCV